MTSIILATNYTELYFKMKVLSHLAGLGILGLVFIIVCLYFAVLWVEDCIRERRFKKMAAEAAKKGGAK